MQTVRELFERVSRTAIGDAEFERQQDAKAPISRRGCTTMYQELIATIAPGYDPRHVEAFLRLEFGTLDHLSRGRFEHEVREACACIDAAPDVAEQVARSYGL